MAHTVEAQHLFRAVRTVVHESYHDRDVSCVTYVVTDSARQKLHPLSGEQEGEAALFVQHLAAIARRQKLPDSYLRTFMVGTAASDSEQTAPAEQNTDPLPLLKEKNTIQSGIDITSESLTAARSSRWLIALAIYLALLLLVLLAFAVLQGLGIENIALSNDFTPLGVPWQELVYGLLGGCTSSIITLGRARSTNPAVFVIIIWFTRPYVGVVLAILAYLFLNSGLFNLVGNLGPHSALFLLVAALAGLCESWFFVRRR